jgi:hypothetical protein
VLDPLSEPGDELELLDRGQVCRILWVSQRTFERLLEEDAFPSGIAVTPR